MNRLKVGGSKVAETAWSRRARPAARSVAGMRNFAISKENWTGRACMCVCRVRVGRSDGVEPIKMKDEALSERFDRIPCLIVDNPICPRRPVSFRIRYQTSKDERREWGARGGMYFSANVHRLLRTVE